MATPVHACLKIEKLTRHTPDIVTLWLTGSLSRLRFKAGQFAHLTLEEYDPSQHWPESRVFSIASGPSQKEGLRFTISRQGDYTARIIDSLKEGQEIWIKGPYGDFTLQQNADTHTVLIAGGTGITPFCSLLEELKIKPATATGTLDLFYGVRTRDLFIYKNLVDEAKNACPKLHAEYFSEDDTQTGRLSIDKVFSSLQSRGIAPLSTLYYLSGPKGMIDAFKTSLTRDHGIPEAQVCIDAWD